MLFFVLHYKDLRGDVVEERNETLKGVRQRVKYVPIYSKIEKNLALSSFPCAQVADFISKGKISCSFVPAAA